MTRQTIPLTTFTLCDAEPGSGIDDVRRRPESDWLPAPVPGGVHEALLAAGRIADPYFDRNEVSVRWVEERDWWFRAMVPAASSPPGGRTLLVCRGLDTVADLWLDGQPLGHSENMFRPCTFDVTGRLEAAAELLICFRPPLAGLTPPAAATNLLGRLGDALAAVAPEEPAGEEGAGIWSATLPLATLRRKATFSWGWDFGPRLPSIGPWRPVEVVQESGAVLSGHHVRTERVDVARRTADLTVRVEATQLQEDLRPVAEVELVAPSGSITSLTVPLASEGAAAETLSGAASVRVADAELWWTHDLGGQPRYQVTGHGMDFGAGDGAFASVGESRLYRRYAADQGKFISEFGIHASPELSTLQRWLPDDQLQVHGPGFDHHNKDHPKNKHDPVLDIVTGLPSSMQQYVDFTMISQAEGLKFGIEHYRRRQPHCSGTLIWQFNDVWPGFSWSVVDYAGVPKAGYHYARRAYAPVIATFCQGADGELQLWICNSSAVPVSCDAEVTLARFSAAADLVAGVVAEIEPAQTRLVWSVPGDAYSATADTYAWVRSPSGAFAPNRYFFAEIKDMDFGPSRVESEILRTSADRAVVRVRATGFNYFVRIPTPAPEVRFSDNYLDLRDGDLAEIAVRGLTEHIGDDQLQAISGLAR